MRVVGSGMVIGLDIPDIVLVLCHSHVMVGSSTVTVLDIKDKWSMLFFCTVGWCDLLYSDTSRYTGHLVSNVSQPLVVGTSVLNGLDKFAVMCVPHVDCKI